MAKRNAAQAAPETQAPATTHLFVRDPDVTSVTHKGVTYAVAGRLVEVEHEVAAELLQVARTLFEPFTGQEGANPKAKRSAPSEQPPAPEDEAADSGDEETEPQAPDTAPGEGASDSEDAAGK